MDCKEYRVPPNKGVIAVLLTCMVGACLLFFYRPSSYIHRYIPPEMLLLFVFYSLSMEWKTLLLSENAIRVRSFPVFKERVVTFDRVKCVEFVPGRKSKSEERYVLITLDSCPSFSESKYKHVDTFIAIHPFRVIFVRIWDKEEAEWERYIKCKVSRQGDGSLS